jgi:hypothetical protein
MEMKRAASWSAPGMRWPYALSVRGSGVPEALRGRHDGDAVGEHLSGHEMP